MRPSIQSGFNIQLARAQLVCAFAQSLLNDLVFDLSAQALVASTPVSKRPQVKSEL